MCLPPSVRRFPAYLSLLLFVTTLLVAACSPGAKTMNKGLKKLAKGKTDKAEKKFERLKSHPKFDLAAEYYLLGIHTKKAKRLKEWALADSSYENLKNRVAHSGADKKRLLKSYKVSERSIENKRIRLERKAFQLADQQGSVILLDSIDRLFLEWEEKAVPEWNATRTRVVNRNLPTSDYRVATSIINRHFDVVEPRNYPHFWKMREEIWDLFTKQFDRCYMNRFKADNPWHYYSRDCWFGDARDMFCQNSLQAALAFLDQHPYSLLEWEVLDYVEALEKNKAQVENLLPAEQSHLDDLDQYHQLIETLDCGSQDTATLKRDIYHYLNQYAPRYSAFTLLKRAVNYYVQTNHPQVAQRLLTDIRPIFPDTALCPTSFEFQVRKQPWIEKGIDCLDGFASRPIPQFIRRWDTSNHHEYSAVSWDEGEEAYFARKEGKDVWVMRSYWENGEWTTPQKIEVLSVKKRAIPLSITADGLQMLLKIGKYLLISSRSEVSEEWGKPQRLNRAFPGMSRAVFAPDGSAILLDANFDPAELWQKPAGNLYYCERDDNGNFKKPKSLGPIVNTKNDKDSNPYLCSDGKTLLFCSTGREGFGKMDVYMSRKTGDTWTDWSEPVSLECPINSIWDDFGFTWVPADGRNAFFTLAETCDKDFDIWQTDLPEHARPLPQSYIRGMVTGSDKKTGLKGTLKIRINYVQETEAPIIAGKYRFLVPDSAQTLELYPDVPDFFTPRDTLHILKGLKAGGVLRDTFLLLSKQEIKKGYPLPYVDFEPGAARLVDTGGYKSLRTLGLFAGTFKTGLHIIGLADQKAQLPLAKDRAGVLVKILRDSFKISKLQLTAESRERSATDAKTGSGIIVTFDFPGGGASIPPRPTPPHKNTAGVKGNKGAGAESKHAGNNNSKLHTIKIEPDTTLVKKPKNVVKRVFRWLIGKKTKSRKEDSPGKDDTSEDSDDGM